MSRARRRWGHGWFAREHAGISGWGLLLAAVALIGLGGVYYVVSQQPQAEATTPSSTLAATEAPIAPITMPIALILGDSNTVGTTASTSSKRWTTLVATELGWREANYAVSGTGYAATSGVTGCGRTFCANYQGSLSAAVADGVEADIVVVTGGSNDGGRWNDDPELMAGAIDATFLAVQQAYPDAEIVAIGVPWIGEPMQWEKDFDGAVEGSVGGVGGTFVSLIDPPLLEDLALGVGDGAHLNDKGHAAVAARIVNALQE
ncbi:SGNH/GDSL hydrolase family protein [Demequina maris]|uniref:SGNH/GDSL hydrolase family protein n=1 Tax=Demequina maris TaxID=1638982 RepID=UPI000780A9F6|nr:SGNH/GDSL hydrolase family protein [Demequina maris]